MLRYLLLGGCLFSLGMVIGCGKGPTTPVANSPVATVLHSPGNNEQPDLSGNSEPPVQVNPETAHPDNKPEKSNSPGPVTGPLIEEDEPSTGPKFTVTLEELGEKKIMVIKVVREHTQLGLAAAKDLVEKAPVLISYDLNEQQAQEFKKALEEQGAKVSMKQSSKE